MSMKAVQDHISNSSSNGGVRMKKEKPMMSVTAIIQGSQSHWSPRASVTRK